MKPRKDWILRPIQELEGYLDSDNYFCNAIHFSPKEDGVDFAEAAHEYPEPFIEIVNHKTSEVFYFKIPEIIAYYAVKHPGYTYEGLDRYVAAGVMKAKNQMREALGLEEKETK